MCDHTVVIGLPLLSALYMSSNSTLHLHCMQVYPELFNKAMLMNAGFSAAKQLREFDCVIFHDVDLLPLDDRNFYTCSPTPRHVAGFIDERQYK
jgi:N-terminal region of glycosyl transferase group 7